MRLFAVLALLLLAAAPARDWRRVAAPVAEGAYRIGNPAARVKLVEYGSYTCPHCAEFAAESGPVLKDRLIRGGTVALEYHHLIRDGLDLAAVILARCGGPRRFAAAHDLIFATQGRWLQRGYEFQQANSQRLAMYPQLGQLRALADGAGLTELVQAAGLTPAATDACFADAAAVDRLLKAPVPAAVTSTPTFFVNGRAVSHTGWAGLLPVLRAAGAR